MFELRIVVIGGGIAGLAFAIAMKKSGKSVVVKTKFSILGAEGMAFLINGTTLNKIIDLQINHNDLLSYPIQNFLLLNNFGSSQNDIPLSEWYSIKRYGLMQYLADQLEAADMHEDCDFSHFIYENGNAIAAIFKDGTVEYGDLFVGADGINSKVRKEVCDSQFFPSQINEIVCVVESAALPKYKHTFRKYLSVNNGLSFGYIPLNEEEHVWFCQFKSDFVPEDQKNDAASNRKICEQLLNEFPDEVRQIVAKTDFERSHLWRSQELQLLERYYKSNVCLIGDAATGSISLTSAGVSSAITSALELAHAINTTLSIDSALFNYNEVRKAAHLNLIDYASTLKQQFLNGLGEISRDELKLPFMK